MPDPHPNARVKPQAPGQGSGPGAPPAEPTGVLSGAILIGVGVGCLGLGFLLLWLGSTTAPPFLIIFGYLLIGTGILW